MTEVLFIDSETFSETPLGHGTHRYAEGAEVMLLPYAWNHDPVTVLEFPARGDVEELLDYADVIVGQNFGNFDTTVFLHALGIDVPPEKVFDTMACALSHSLPGSLGALCEILGVPAELAKSKEGKQLISLFCKPQPKGRKLRRATKATHPAEWTRFRDVYAPGDVTSMQSLYYDKLPRWNFDIGKPEHRLWCLDYKINKRGVRVDLALAEAAIAASNAEKAILNARTSEVTRGAVEKATQRDALLKHLVEEYGVELPDMTKATLERRIEDPDLPEPVRELLSMRLLVSTTSASKYKRLIDGVSSDGILRGLLQFCGALRTGRWAGRLFQPQNLPRPVIEHIAQTLGCSEKEAEDDERMIEYIELGIAALKGGYADLIIDDVIILCINLVRSVMFARDGKKLCVADLSNIEGRTLAWLAGEEWKLDAFRDFDNGTGEDLYKITAGRILNKPAKEVTKGERQVSGKVSELALGYQGAVGAFTKMAALYGVELEEDAVIKIVKGWRKANPAIASFWYAMEDAARKATENPGQVFAINKIRFRRDGAWLKMRLPSDRFLCYPSPRIEDVKTPCKQCDGDKVILPEGAPDDRFLRSENPHAVRCPTCKGTGFKWRSQLTYMGVDQYTRKWTRIKTYGGKLVENATQAVARDVLAAGMLAADKAGFDVLLSVHDELITEADKDGLLTSRDLEACMVSQLGWTAGLPLAAAGFEAERYRK